MRHEKPFVFNEWVQPAQLPASCSPPGTICTVSGWGETLSYIEDQEALRSLNVPILSSTDCDNSYPGQISDTMFCAGFLGGGKGTVRTVLHHPYMIFETDTATEIAFDLTYRCLLGRCGKSSCLQRRNTRARKLGLWLCGARSSRSLHKSLLFYKMDKISNRKIQLAQ